MIRTENQKLPNGWTLCSLGDLVLVLRGVSYKKNDAKERPHSGLIPILRATNINSNLNFDGLVYVPQHYVPDLSVV